MPAQKCKITIISQTSQQNMVRDVKNRLEINHLLSVKQFELSIE